MIFTPTPIAGAWEIRTEPRGDARGQLVRTFCRDTFARAGLGPGMDDLQFVQTNLTRTQRTGTVRGMHYQKAPAQEVKLVRCLQGAVHDVIVDLRPHSPTFLRWHAVHLSDDNETELLIPHGCAHGFQTLSDDVRMLYQHSAPYTPALEAGVRPDDPAIAIAWPLPIGLLSERDQHHPLIDERFEGVPT